MLQIKNIVKTYKTGDLVQNALKGVSLNLRDNEFLAILGPSGSGKTTLLNIIGGLDKYDDGDLIINNISTKNYKDKDWDAYRNHTIGFVFQSYNLIPHQSVLSNVELALTIAGISKKERKRRALEALDAVGLKEQAHKKPNQMSGGQMQRVAIARALVNNPSIVLADEPTGALDTKTSVQVMELLKEVAKDRLVVMVTHNPELAEQYANRIVNLKDGEIVGDTNPYEINKEDIKPAKSRRIGKAKMSYLTALSLSFNNLLTKKGRTILTAFAGSIGIIGIALILALSTGFQNYINDIQSETMSSYPLTIQSETTNVFSAMMTARVESKNEIIPEGKVKEQTMISTMMNSIGSNDLKSFKKWLEDNEKDVYKDVNKISYSYSVSPRIFTKDVNGTITQLNPNTIMSSIYSDGAMSLLSSFSSSSSMGTFAEYETETVKDNCELLLGEWPVNYDDVILVLSQKDKIPDIMVYSLGLRDNNELRTLIAQVMSDEAVTINNEPYLLDYEDLMNIDLKLIDTSDLYRYNEKYNTYEDMTSDEEYMNKIYDSSKTLHITGIATPKEDGNNMAGVIYSHALVEYVIEEASKSEIVQKQLTNKDIDVFSGKRFDDNSSKAGLDFNDFVSIDEKMLTSAFKFNISEDDFKMDAMTPEESMAIMDKYASMYAPLVSNASEIVASFNTLIFNAYITEYEDATRISFTESMPPVMKLDISDYETFAETINGTSYKEKLNKIFENATSFGLDNDTIQMMKGFILVFTNEDYDDLSKACKGMFIKYYQTIDTTLTEVENDSIIYNFNIQTLSRIYSDGTNTLLSPALMSLVTIDQDVLKTYLTVSDRLAKTFMVAAIGQSTGELMMPMIESFGKFGELFKGDIMSVDTDAFQKAFRFDMNEDEIKRLMSSMMTSNSSSYSSNLIALGYQDIDEPTSISIFFKDFDTKEHFLTTLDNYNETVEEEKQISYMDITGLLMSSVSTIVDAVTYVLIAFVSISLIVSSIMIAVITLISVMERTKEIGILRAMGASKRNVSSIFSAETFIIGLLSGTLGVTVSYLLTFPINDVIYKLTEISNIKAVLGLKPAIILVIISVVLTMFAGFMPSKKAAKQDPVIALRTE